MRPHAGERKHQHRKQHAADAERKKARPSRAEAPKVISTPFHASSIASRHRRSRTAPASAPCPSIRGSARAHRSVSRMAPAHRRARFAGLANIREAASRGCRTGWKARRSLRPLRAVRRAGRPARRRTRRSTGDDGSFRSCACASSRARPSVSSPAESALAGARSPRAIPSTPVIAFSTERLKAVGETGSFWLRARRMSVVRLSSPCREAKTRRTPSPCAWSAGSGRQSCATFSAARERLLSRRRTIGSMKPTSAAPVTATDQRMTGRVQRRASMAQ